MNGTYTQSICSGSLNNQPSSSGTLESNNITYPCDQKIYIRVQTHTNGTCGGTVCSTPLNDFDALATLPVTFGAIKATVANDALTVNWTSESEINNDHFEVEGSNDGVNFTTLGTVKSTAHNGNSNEAIHYSFSRSASELSLGISFLAFALGGFYKRKKWLAAALVLAGVITIVYSCAKNSGDARSSKDGKYYVRITQVDIDGQKSSSKIIQVANN